MRKTTILISSCIVTLLLGYTGYRGYQVWKQNHWLTLAKNFAAKSDIRNEMLSLQQVLRANPHNLEACRLAANLADAIHSPAALIFRQRVVELDPNSSADRLALVQTAMYSDDYSVATNTLADMDESSKKTADYHNLAGLVALGLGQISEAEMHFSEATRLEPINPIPQLNLSILRLHSTNSLDVAEARIILKRISLDSTNATMRVQAQRALTMDAVHFNDWGTALTLSKDLVQPTNTIFGDQLLRLDVLREAKSPEYKTTLTQYERMAAVDLTKLSDMTKWLMLRTSPSDALAWLHSLPMQIQTNSPGVLLVAQCQLQLRDWRGLQGTLQNQNWDETEFVRHALLARAFREQGLNAAAMAEWSQALQFANDRKNSFAAQKGILSSLYVFAKEWKWNSEAEQILWTMVNRYPEEKWVAPVLTKALMAGGRTRSLMQLFDLIYKRQPDDLENKNNLAYTAMLLGETELNVNNMAQEVYAKAPQNPSYAATYALSLYLQKNYPEALAVLQKLTPQQLQDPSIAGYYSIVLKANGNGQRAKEYLRLTASVPLLPEEQKLFEGILR